MAKQKPLTLKGDDAHCILCAAFDYSLGRKTYMPYTMMDVVRDHIDEISTRTLYIFNQRLECAERDYYENWQEEEKTRGYSNYGMKYDREAWQAFHSWLKGVIAEREGVK